MRHPLVLALVLPALIPLAGCNNNAYESAYEGAFKTSFRASFVESCMTSARASAGDPRADFQPLCGCVADKLLTMSATSKELTANAESLDTKSAVIRDCRNALVPGSAGPAPVKP